MGGTDSFSHCPTSPAMWQVWIIGPSVFNGCCCKIGQHQHCDSARREVCGVGVQSGRMFGYGDFHQTGG